MERKITISCAQIAQSNEPYKNYESMSKVIREIGKRSDLIVFPETSLSGETKLEDLQGMHELLSIRAEVSKVGVVYGFYNRIGKRTFNTLRFLDKNGQVLADYQKIHLWGEEGVSRGKNTPVIEFENIKFGMMNCWDLAYSDVSRRLVKKGAEVIIAPSYWFGKEFKTEKKIEELVGFQAFSNVVYLAYCDAYNFDGSTTGKSRILSPLETLAQARAGQQDIITATIDVEKLKEYRKVFDCWR